MLPRIVPDILSGKETTFIAADASVREAARIMAELRIGALLVGTREHLAGILSERDLVSRVLAPGRDPDATRVAEVMTPDPDTIAPDAFANEALDMMREGGYRHLPVIDNGRVVGIVSVRDLYAAIESRLEEDLQEREAFLFQAGLGDRH